MKVIVLMSTYNGALYIREQIASILNQTGVDIELIIRDDCSKDNTRDILKDIAGTCDKIKLIFPNENYGPCKSFLYLITRYCDADFFALADQDDIWDEDKLLCAINQIKNISGPAMYHSNLRVVDEYGNYIRNAHSFEQVALTKYSFLCEPLATGCTIVYNRKLAKILYGNEPIDFSMHDTWVYCVASLFGEVVYDYTPHMSYRQHTTNVVGTYNQALSIKAIGRQISYIFSEKNYRLINAEILFDIFKDSMNSEQKEKIKKVLQYKESIFNMLLLIKDKDIRPASFYRQIRYYIKVLLGKF